MPVYLFLPEIDQIAKYVQDTECKIVIVCDVSFSHYSSLCQL